MDAIIIIVVGILVAVAVPILGLANLKYDEEHNYKCKKCSHEFDIYGNGLNSFRIPFRSYVKCPRCGKYSDVEIVKKQSKTGK